MGSFDHRTCLMERSGGRETDWWSAALGGWAVRQGGGESVGWSQVLDMGPGSPSYRAGRKIFMGP